MSYVHPAAIGIVVMPSSSSSSSVGSGSGSVWTSSGSVQRCALVCRRRRCLSPLSVRVLIVARSPVGQSSVGRLHVDQSLRARSSFSTAACRPAAIITARPLHGTLSVCMPTGPRSRYSHTHTKPAIALARYGPVSVSVTNRCCVETTGLIEPIFWHGASFHL